MAESETQYKIIWNPNHLAKWQELVIIAKYSEKNSWKKSRFQLIY